MLVLERRSVVGGAAVTEEFHPGFRNSVASYTVSLLQPKVIADLNLAAHGLRVVPRRINNFLPLDGDYLLAGPGRTAAEVARFSVRDAAQLPLFEQRLEAFADVLRDTALQAPPNVGEGSWLRQLPELWRAGQLGRRLHGLEPAVRQELLDLSPSLRRSISTAGLKVNRSRRCLDLTASLATTPVRTRRARPMCCCITPSAKATG